MELKEKRDLELKEVKLLSKQYRKEKDHKKKMELLMKLMEKKNKYLFTKRFMETSRKVG